MLRVEVLTGGCVAERVGFGIIGAGEIARGCMSVFKANPRASVVAVADVNVDAAASLASEVGAEVVLPDYREIFALSDVEAVYVAPPPFLHRAMVLEAIAAEKHVICEKPLMMNAAELREIIAASENKRHLKIA